jgi:hypothetical protein
MPGAQCTLVCAGGSKSAHQYLQRRHRKHPAFPTQWFERLLRAPRGPGFLAPVIRRPRTGPPTRAQKHRTQAMYIPREYT